MPVCYIRTLLASNIGEGNGTPIQYSCLENPMDGGAWYPGEGNGNPLQYSCLENPMDGRAWQGSWGHKELDTEVLCWPSMGYFIIK